MHAWTLARIMLHQLPSNACQNVEHRLFLFGSLFLQKMGISLSVHHRSQRVVSLGLPTDDSERLNLQVSDCQKLKRGLPKQRKKKTVKQAVKDGLNNSENTRDNLFDGRSLDVDFPSETELTKKTSKQDPAKYAYRPKIDPSETSLILFPGQGSQFIGMGSKLLDYPNVLNLYDTARKILGYDLLEVCLRGPVQVLNKTVVCQPAVLVTSLAAVERLKCDNPWAVEHCISAAGYDVGEISALVFSGVISFENAVRFVKARAEAMQAASQLVPSGALIVFFGHDAKVGFACHAAKLYCLQKLGMQDAVCQISEYLYSGCKIIAGNQEALDFIERNAKEFGIQRVRRSPVSGAFHSRLMHSALAPMARTLGTIELAKPVVPVHSNVTARQYRVGSRFISNQLLQQICKPVMWEQTMHVLYSRNGGEAFPSTFEVGPGRQLGAILRQINAKAYHEYTSVEV